MDFILIASYTGTPTVAITVTDIYESQDTYMLPVINWFMGPNIVVDQRTDGDQNKIRIKTR